ncbi:MAG: tetratricopeptide repeat protein [Gammaproteobacteria bacterium]|nr:tetratricopeptide repeat protein [Gammaproteobacteria bacterium]
MTLRNISGLLLIFFLTGHPAIASEKTEANYTALQNFCLELNQWMHGGRKGPYPSDRGLVNIGWFNHYCNAVDRFSTLYAPKNKAQELESIRFIDHEVQYTISNNPNHYLLPEVYFTLGKAYLLTRNYALAETNLLKALSLDPTFAPVYVTLSELYITNKRLDAAVKSVQAGLALNPDLKGLKRRAKQLGIPAPEQSPVPVPPETPLKPPVDQAGENKPEAQVEEATPAPYLPPTEIGSPTNPWCRFCPVNEAAPAAPSPSTPGVVPKDWK